MRRDIIVFLAVRGRERKNCHRRNVNEGVALSVECFAFALVIIAAWLMPAPVRAAPAAVA